MATKNYRSQSVDDDANCSTTSCSENEFDNILLQEQEIPCNFKALLKSGSDLSFFVNPTVSSLPCPPSGSMDHKDSNGASNVKWFACVLWNSDVLSEVELHEEVGNKLYSTLGMGRLMSRCVLERNQSWPGIRFMDWKKPFMLVEIIDDNFGTCGLHPCLRVRETSTEKIAIGMKPRLWDLVVFKECKSLADEMVRRYRDGIKTTVILWNARVDVYPEPWIDGDDDEGFVLGEVFLKSAREKLNPLSVLIFHHETMSKGRSKRVQSSSKQSELIHFQDSSLPYKLFSYSSLFESVNHFSFHVTSYYENEKKTAEVPIPTSPNVTRRITRAMNNDNSEERLLIRERGNTVSNNVESDLEEEETVLTVSSDEEEEDVQVRNDSRLQSQPVVPSIKSSVLDDNSKRQTRSKKNSDNFVATSSPSKKKSDNCSPSKKKLKLDCERQSQGRAVQKSQTDSQLEIEEDEDQYRFTELFQQV